MFVSTGTGWRDGPLRMPATAALLLIDCQKAFTSAGNPASAAGAEDALAHAVRLARLFQDLSLPVFATMHVHSAPPPRGGMGSWWNTFLEEGDAAAGLDPAISGIAPKVIRKECYSALRGTGLVEDLEMLGVDTLVLCGFLTHICVDSTARHAFQLGYDVLVVSDACASVSTSLHEASLLCLSHAVARVETTGRIARVLGSC